MKRQIQEGAWKTTSLRKTRYTNETYTDIGNVHGTQYWGAFSSPLLPSKSNKYYKFWYVLVALIIQHEQRMLHTALSFVWLYHISPHYLINGMIFGKVLLIIKCVF